VGSRARRRGRGADARGPRDDEGARRLEGGQKLRLAGKGLPKPGGGAGDLYALLSIAVPATLTEAEQKLYEQLRETSRFDPRARFK
jgi:DnaJ-class molecular chaperone